MTTPKYEPYDFANRRHIGPSPAEMDEMLATCGVADLDELIGQTVPEAIRMTEPLDFGARHRATGRPGLCRAARGRRRIRGRRYRRDAGIGQGGVGYLRPPGRRDHRVEPGDRG